MATTGVKPILLREARPPPDPWPALDGATTPLSP
jgi:hypothetical protein